MKLAVTAKGGSLSAQMDERFGRCEYFVVVDSETLKFTAFFNPAMTASGGAGPAAAREIAKHGAQVLLTGQVGTNAQQALAAARINVVAMSGGTVKEVVETYLQGQA